MESSVQCQDGVSVKYVQDGVSVHCVQDDTEHIAHWLHPTRSILNTLHTHSHWLNPEHIGYWFHPGHNVWLILDTPSWTRAHWLHPTPSWTHCTLTPSWTQHTDPTLNTLCTYYISWVHRTWLHPGHTLTGSILHTVWTLTPSWTLHHEHTAYWLHPTQSWTQCTLTPSWAHFTLLTAYPEYTARDSILDTLSLARYWVGGWVGGIVNCHPLFSGTVVYLLGDDCYCCVVRFPGKKKQKKTRKWEWVVLVVLRSRYAAHMTYLVYQEGCLKFCNEIMLMCAIKEQVPSEHHLSMLFVRAIIAVCVSEVLDWFHLFTNSVHVQHLLIFCKYLYALLYTLCAVSDFFCHGLKWGRIIISWVGGGRSGFSQAALTIPPP